MDIKKRLERFKKNMKNKRYESSLFFQLMTLFMVICLAIGYMVHNIELIILTAVASFWYLHSSEELERDQMYVNLGIYKDFWKKVDKK